MATEISKLQPAKFVQIKDLFPGTHGHNLVVKVASSSVVLEKMRADGTKIRVAEAVVGDASGSVIFTARNDQIPMIDSCGTTVIIRNARIDMFKGFMRLSVDKWGKLEAATQPASFDVNIVNNLSNVEYELVTISSSDDNVG